MPITPCTPGAREMLKEAQIYALSRGSRTFTADHILLTMIRRNTGLGVATLRHAGVNLQVLQQALEKNLESIEDHLDELQPAWKDNIETNPVLKDAATIAGEFKHHWVGTEHILLAIIQDESTASSRLLRHFGLTFVTATHKALEVIDGLPGRKPVRLDGSSATTDPRTPYTPGTREVIKLSKAEAGRLGHDYIGPEHFLLAMIRRREGLAVKVLQRLGVDLDGLKIKLEHLLVAGKGPNTNLFGPNAEGKKALGTARNIAINMKQNWLGSEHLLLAILTEKATPLSRLLGQFGLTFDSTMQTVVEIDDETTSDAPPSGE